MLDRGRQRDLLVVGVTVALLVAACGPATAPVGSAPTPLPPPARPAPPTVAPPAATVVPPVPTVAPTDTPVATVAAPTAEPTAVPTHPATPTAVPAMPSPTATVLPTTRLLSVPLHRQEHALSCEAAALQMALATLGRDVAEDDLLAALAQDPTPRTVHANGAVEWGDPDVGFVGRWDGVFARDGYGVYEGPIADLAHAAGFPGSTPLQDAPPRQLYDAVRAGFPVVVWMPYGGRVKGRGAWTTPAGKEIDYVVTEHAVVLAGVGDDSVTYADPYTASLEHMPFGTFESALARLGNRAVIVRP